MLLLSFNIKKTQWKKTFIQQSKKVVIIQTNYSRRKKMNELLNELFYTLEEKKKLEAKEKGLKKTNTKKK